MIQVHRRRPGGREPTEGAGGRRSRSHRWLSATDGGRHRDADRTVDGDTDDTTGDTDRVTDPDGVADTDRLSDTDGLTNADRVADADGLSDTDTGPE